MFCFQFFFGEKTKLKLKLKSDHNEQTNSKHIPDITANPINEASNSIGVKCDYTMIKSINKHNTLYRIIINRIGEKSQPK
ncbi:hypothetical protein DERP_010557 [Dermatophagoides pteronyssinus]|uniref:Uncharacterized protein n=1 Tax=Dermatophagoides pteronyssinus TaxID=6956 RepID=A0ABQ8JGA4_DERPT|nr:hypothetical protein DERP_010557 [Dermatophagoides pteronyssinus]